MALDKAKIREEVQRLISSKNWNKALEELQKLVILEARDPEIRLKIGDVHLMMDNKTRAIEEYKKALKLLEKSGSGSSIVPLCQKILEIDSYQEDVKEILQKFQAQAPVKEEIVLKEVVTREEMPPIPLFSDLTESEFKRVLAKAQAEKFSAEEIIVKEGDRGNSIYFVTSGEAKVFKKTKDEKQVMVDVLKEGNFFGEFGFFGDSKRHASVVASSDIEVLEISKDALEEVIKEFPHVSDVLVEFYKIRILDTLLALSPLFRGIRPLERKKLISRFQLMVAEDGQEIIKEGEPGDALYIIKSGLVEVITHNARGEKVELARLTEGDFFGEIALITGAPRTATVRALKETRLMKLGKKEFQEIASVHPEVMEVAKSYLEHRAEETIGVLMSSAKEQSGLV